VAKEQEATVDVEDAKPLKVQGKGNNYGTTKKPKE